MKSGQDPGEFVPDILLVSDGEQPCRRIFAGASKHIWLNFGDGRNYTADIFVREEP